MVWRDATDGEIAAQVVTTVALEFASDCRDDAAAYTHWIHVAQVASDRARLSMIDRGVQLFTRRNRKDVTS